MSTSSLPNRARMLPQLDLADRRILFELDCDSRQSLSELARRVRLGRDLVAYRMERLQSTGILRRCSMLINPYKLGFTVYKTYLRLETNRVRAAELIAQLDRHPSTYWMAECYGSWDLMFSILARTPKEFYDYQGQILSDFSDIVMDSEVATLVNYWWFPKKYLLGARWQEERVKCPITSESTKRAVNGWSFQTPEFTLGTTPEHYHLDDLEYRLVQQLGKDARLSFAELAERLGTSPAVIKYRLEKLQQRCIVAGYRVDTDRAALGMSLFRVMVHLRDYSVEKEVEFREFCRRHPHIAGYVQQIGTHKVEIEVEAADHAQFTSVIDEIREKFSKHVRSMDYLTIRQDYYHRTPSGVLDVVEKVPAVTLAAAS